MARKARVSAALLALMRRGDHHAWILEDLHAALARAGTESNFSSVFRAVEKLVADGAVRKLVVDNGRARFETAGAHHDHLHCTRCDEVLPVPCIVDTAALAAASGGTITEHSLIVTGTCPACRTADPR